MSLNELARTTGFPPATLNDFVKRGLLPSPSATPSATEVLTFLRKVGDLNYAE